MPALPLVDKFDTFSSIEIWMYCKNEIDSMSQKVPDQGATDKRTPPYFLDCASKMGPVRSGGATRW
jgi:hypothetical protein